MNNPINKDIKYINFKFSMYFAIITYIIVKWLINVSNLYKVDLKYSLVMWLCFFLVYYLLINNFPQLIGNFWQYKNSVLIQSIDTNRLDFQIMLQFLIFMSSLCLFFFEPKLHEGITIDYYVAILLLGTFRTCVIAPGISFVFLYKQQKLNNLFENPIIARHFHYTTPKESPTGAEFKGFFNEPFKPGRVVASGTIATVGGVVITRGNEDLRDAREDFKEAREYYTKLEDKYKVYKQKLEEKSLVITTMDENKLQEKQERENQKKYIDEKLEYYKKEKEIIDDYSHQLNQDKEGIHGFYCSIKYGVNSVVSEPDDYIPHSARVLLRRAKKEEIESSTFSMKYDNSFTSQEIVENTKEMVPSILEKKNQIIVFMVGF